MPIFEPLSTDQGTDSTTVFDENTDDPIDGLNQYNYLPDDYSTDEWVDYQSGDLERPLRSRI